MKNNHLYVGGQAVIEGVMMRTPKSMAIAVRRESGKIVIRETAWHSIWDRLKFLKWPFFRGTVVMIEALINGVQALNFSIEEATVEQGETQGKTENASGWSIALTMIIGLVFAIGLFKFVPHLAATYTGYVFVGRTFTVNDISYHVIDGIVKLGIFVGYVAIIGLAKDIARVFQYHGAEHMSIYTYEAGEGLTVDNARNKTTLHPRCGTSFIMVVILIFIIVAALSMPYIPEWAKPIPGGSFARHILVVLFKLPLLIPVAGIAYEFNRFAGKHPNNPLLRPFLWPGLAMQLLTTKRPTDDQLEIALASLRAVLWREQEDNATTHQESPTVYDSYLDIDKVYPAVAARASE